MLRSKQQQKLFGLVGVKKGDVPKSDVSKDVKDIVDKMSKKDIEDFHQLNIKVYQIRLRAS